MKPENVSRGARLAFERIVDHRNDMPRIVKIHPAAIDVPVADRGEVHVESESYARHLVPGRHLESVAQAAAA